MSDHEFSQACLVLGTVSLFVGFRTLRLYRRIQNTPTSRIRSMAAGPVELCGRVDAAPTLVSPVTATPCAWWSYRIEEHRGGKRPWIAIAHEDSSPCPLLLADETGETPLDLTDVAVTPTHTYRDQTRRPREGVARLLRLHGLRPTRRLRVTEQRVHAGERVFLHAALRVASDVKAAHGRIARLGALRDAFSDPGPAPPGGMVRAEPSDPRALREALARRLRALKREALAATGAKRLSPRDLTALRDRARDQVNSERAQASGAMARLDALARGSLDASKAAPSEARVAASLLRDPRWAIRAACATTLVGSDPLGQAVCFLRPGDESRALFAHSWGLVAIGGGLLAIAAGLIGFAL